MTCKRYGNKWTINEILSLQREYELLKMDVAEIAKKHQRSEMSIAYKLRSEGFVNSMEHARGFINVKNQNIDLVYSLQETDEEETLPDDSSVYTEDNEEEDEKLTTNLRLSIMTTQVQSLENTVKELVIKVTELNENFVRNQPIFMDRKIFMNQVLEC